MITEYLPYAACLLTGGLIGAFGIGCCAVAKIADDGYDEDLEADLWIARHNEGVFRARIQTITDIARSQQSIKSGRILDVLEG